MPLQHENVSELYEHFRDSVVLVEIGRWGREQFGLWLDGMSRKLAEREAALRNLEIPPAHFDSFVREMEVGFEGVAHVNDGIALMHRYVDGEDEQILWQGLELIRKGNERVNEAMRLNRESRAVADDS